MRLVGWGELGSCVKLNSRFWYHEQSKSCDTNSVPTPFNWIHVTQESEASRSLAMIYGSELLPRCILRTADSISRLFNLWWEGTRRGSRLGRCLLTISTRIFFCLLEAWKKPRDIFIVSAVCQVHFARHDNSHLVLISAKLTFVGIASASTFGRWRRRRLEDRRWH